MDSGRSTRALPRVSFLIRRSRDQRSVSTSPGLIAAAHVLHRLLAPRHPPCALSLLIRKNTLDVAMEFSRCARARSARSYTKAAPQQGLGPSKLNSVRPVLERTDTCNEVDVVLGESDHRTARAEALGINESNSLRSKSSGFPRKEVIQPHLPVRLPCYDFTPIIDPTFDGCLPKRG
jgi:hypothetical protein